MDLGSMIPPNLGEQVFGAGWFAVQVVLLLVVMAGGAGYYWYASRYNTPCIILQKVGNHYQASRRKAYIKRSMGNTEMFLQRFLQKGEKVLPPRDEQFFAAAKGGKILILRQEGNTYMPLTISDRSTDAMHYDEYDVKSFYLAESKRAIDKYKKETWLDKYGNLIAMGVFIMVLFVIFMILFQRIEQLINIVKGLGDQFVLAMRSPAPPGA